MHSGVPDPRHFGTYPDADPAPDPALFVLTLTFKISTKNYLFTLSFYVYSFLKVHLHHSSKIKSHKGVTKQYTSRFFFISVQIN